MMYLPVAHTLYSSKRLHIALDTNEYLRFERGSEPSIILFAPAIIDVSAVEYSRTAGYVHLAGPFQATMRRGERRNFRNLGPYALEEVHAVVETLRRELGLPRQPLELDEQDLVREPKRYRNRIVRSRGVWHRGVDRSVFAGAWLIPADQWNTYGETALLTPDKGVTIDVVGLWTTAALDDRHSTEQSNILASATSRHTEEGAGSESGAGACSAMLDAYLLEVLADLASVREPSAREPVMPTYPQDAIVTAPGWYA